MFLPSKHQPLSSTPHPCITPVQTTDTDIEQVRNRISQIAEHEAQHVSLLSGALGTAAVQPCTYKFPVTDVQSFLGLATLVENVGVSAYLGAASSITEKAYVTVAGSILTTEARHQAWINSAVLKNSGWSGPEDTPLDFNEVFSIASAFIESCPSSNGALPFKAFPALAIGADGTITTDASLDGAFVQVVSGLASNVYPVKNGKVALPTVQGIYYAVLTSTGNNADVNDGYVYSSLPLLLGSPYTLSSVLTLQQHPCRPCHPQCALQLQDHQPRAYFVITRKRQYGRTVMSQSMDFQDNVSLLSGSWDEHIIYNAARHGSFMYCHALGRAVWCRLLSEICFFLSIFWAPH